jgi:hypothetical protein
MEQENEHSLRGIKHGKKIAEEQRFSVERHQAKHPRQTKNWEDYHGCFYTGPHFSNISLLFDLVRFHHCTQNHDEHCRVSLVNKRKLGKEIPFIT